MKPMYKGQLKMQYIKPGYPEEPHHIHSGIMHSLMRVISSDENEEPVYWGLATTHKPKNGKDIFDTYKLRSKIEERYRQHKYFWNLHKFSSPYINLMETHVAFTLMTYSPW